MNRAYLFVAASAGCVIFAGIVLAGPARFVRFIAPAAHAAQCSRLIDSYHKGEREYPERGTDEFEHYAECYYVVCGIRL